MSEKSLKNKIVKLLDRFNAEEDDLQDAIMNLVYSLATLVDYNEDIEEE
jgi:hypothetical protein